MSTADPEEEKSSFVMMHSENILRSHLPLVETSIEQSKAKFIRDIPLKSLKDVMMSSRIPSFHAMDDKKRAGQVTDTYLDDSYIFGLDDGSVTIVSLSKKAIVKHWNIFPSYITTVKVLDDFLLVVSEGGHIVYNLKGFLEGSSESPENIVHSKVFTQGTDNTRYAGDLLKYEDDVLAFVGGWDGSVNRHSLIKKEESHEFDGIMKSRNENRIFAIKAYSPDTFVAMNHEQEFGYYLKGKSIHKAKK